MDALARLDPVVRPLIESVDHALSTLGAPAEHWVWSELRRIGATPGDAVAWAAALDPTPQLALAATVRDRAAACAAARLPVELGWRGQAAQAYTARAAALETSLVADGDDSLAGRLLAMAAYLEAVARWQQRTRDGVGRSLADAMTSAHAITLRLAGSGFDRDGAAAAAAIGAGLLARVAAAIDEGDELRQQWAARLTGVAVARTGGGAGDVWLDHRRSASLADGRRPGRRRARPPCGPACRPSGRARVAAWVSSAR